MKIGVDLGGTNVRAGLINDDAIIRMKTNPLINKDSLEQTIDQVKTAIHSVKMPSVAGIGIGVPSVVDVQKGIVYDVVNIPSWKKVPLKYILEEEFEVPVYINNDSNCFVLGEKYCGFGKQHKNFVGITIGTGIGAGLMINDQLYNGNNCGAGEIGYLPYLDHDFEYYCSGNFFEKIHGVSAYSTFLAAQANDAAALELWKEFGHHVGNVLKAVVYAYDPEAIIFGGSISQAFPYFKTQMMDSLREICFPKSIEKLHIYNSNIHHISMIGAAFQVNRQ